MVATSDADKHIFLIALFGTTPPYQTETVRAISLSTFAICRGCTSESGAEFSASGAWKLEEGGWKDQKQMYFYDCNIPQFKKKKKARILKLAIPFSFFFFFLMPISLEL